MTTADQTARLAALQQAKEAYEAACILLSDCAHTKATQLLQSCLQVSCCAECKPLCVCNATRLAEPQRPAWDAKLVVEGNIA